ncbi:MAG: hypothetical protein NXI24_09095 [bacterium]|nr:hypothetical protein [bacterium]
MRSIQSASPAQNNSVLRLSRATRIGLGAVALAGLLAATSACNSKPNTALCGRYYRHMLAVQERDGQPGALAGLKTEGAKRAVLNHCMELDRAQVECVLDAGDTHTATSCERDGGLQYSDRHDSESENTAASSPAVEEYLDDPNAEYGSDPAAP